jgi:putative endonuclease
VILNRNYRFGHREIDLIVRRDDLVAFVEVKTRAGPGYGHPLEAITALKRREVERVARYWLRHHGHPGTLYRFDAVSVALRSGGDPLIEHIPNAWRLGE